MPYLKNKLNSLKQNGQIQQGYTIFILNTPQKTQIIKILNNTKSYEGIL